MSYMSITTLHMRVPTLVLSITTYIHWNLILFIVRYAVRKMNITWTIFSSRNAAGYCYLTVLCIPWSNVVLFNYNLWPSTTPFRNFRCAPAVICNCCMLLCRSPHDCCQVRVYRWLFTWQKLNRIDKESELVCCSQMRFCFKGSGMLPHAGCFSALACLPGYCSIFCQLEKRDQELSRQDDWVLRSVFQEKG